ncbi:fibronectin-like isoform X2 [Bacillus rossius redtenbacheri]|uniref:fibronectin-like isoform X2 n=1 Tax=Bacillus rossius redtenbacheri TaxID=93214 RepID=UPI002FDD3D34
MELRLITVWALLLLQIYGVTCTADEVTPDAGLRVSNYTAHTVTVAWARPGAVQLCWQRLPPGDSAPVCERPAPGATSHELRLGDACLDYNITLAAAGGPTLSLEFSAARGGKGPGMPRALEGRWSSGGVAAVQWAPGSLCVALYSLRLSGGEVVVEDRVLGSMRSYEKSGLPACAGLNVSVRALDATGRASLPASIALLPLETAPGAVSDLAVVGSRTRRVDLAWTRPQRPDCLRGYSVCWRPSEHHNENCTKLAETHRSHLWHRIEPLQASAEYMVHVASLGAGDLQAISPPLELHTGPEPVANLTVNDLGTHEASVSWKAPARAKLYSVCWGPWSGRGRHYCLNTSETAATLTDLRGVGGGENYTVLVWAVGPGGGASDTTVLTLRKPRPLESLALAGDTHDSMSASWSRPLAGLEAVEVCWARLGSNSSGEECARVSPRAAPHNITGLWPCHWYNVTARGVLSDGTRSEPVSAQHYTAPDGYMPDGGLEDLDSGFEGSQMAVRWQLQEGCTAYVEVCWGVVDDLEHGVNCSTVPGHRSKTSLDGLKLCSNYSIIGTALSPNGTRINSITAYKSSGSGAPRDVTAVIESPGTLRVTWRPPAPEEDCVLKYQLENTELPANATEHVLTDQPLCVYSLYPLLTYAPDVTEPRFTPVYAQSGISAPGPVRSVTVLVARSHYIHIGWENPKKREQCLKKYSVSWRDANSTIQQSDSVGMMLYPRYTISGLESCTEYTIEVTSVGGNATSNATSITALTGPEAVGGMKARQLDPETVDVTWSGTPCTSLYSVCWGAWEGNGSHSCVNVSASGAQVFGLVNLRRGGRYTVIVNAIGQTGSVSDATILILENSCPVSNLTVASHNRDSLSLRWDDLKTSCQRRVHRYEICWLDVSEGAKECTHAAPGSSGYDLLHLEPCKWYNITVTIDYIDGVTSETSSILKFTGIESKEDPDPPTYLVAYGNKGVVVLRYEVTNQTDNCVEYTSVCWIVSTSPTSEQCKMVPSYENQLIIQNAQPCASYSLSASTQTADGRHSPEEKTNVTMGPVPPRNVVARAPSPGTLLITWDPPLPGNDCVDHYVLESGMWWSQSLSDNISADATEYLVSDQPLCEYIFYQLYAVSEVGEASVHSQVYASAGMGAPGEINNLTAVHVASHSIHLGWSTPERYYDCLKKYSVCWTEKSQVNKTCSEQKVVPYPHYSITGLKSCTEYHINVSSQGEEIRGNVSQLLVSTGPEPVRNVTVKATTELVAVEWIPSPCASTYSVCWGEWSDMGNHSCLTTSDNSTTITALEILHPHDKYTVIVRAVSDVGSTSSPYILELVKSSLELTLKEVNATEVVVAWNYSLAGSHPLHYVEVCTKLVGAGDRTCVRQNASLVGDDGGDDGEVTLSGLQPCSAYEVHATAMSSDGTELDTAILDLFTGQAGEQENDTDNKITGFVVTEITSSTVKLEWDGLARKRCIRGYMLEFVNNGELVTEELSNDTNSYVLEDVPPCILLEFMIFAVLPNLQFTTTSKLKTDSGTAAPGEVENVKVYHTTSTSIHLQWDPPRYNDDCLVRYLVCWRAEGDAQVQNCSEQPHTSYNSYSIVGLKPCTNYSFSVAGIGSEKDIGNASSIVWSTGPDQVQSLVADVIKPHQMNLTWGAPECAHGYRVCWGAWADRGVHTCHDVAGTSHAVAGPSDGGAYTVIVEAVAEQGQLSDMSIVSLNGTMTTSNLAQASGAVNKTVSAVVEAATNLSRSLRL